MTKKDYIKAAEIVSKIPPMECGIHSLEVENAFTEFFRDDNPRFDEKRFRAACMAPEEPRKAKPCCKGE